MDLTRHDVVLCGAVGQSAPAPVSYAIAGQSAPASATYNIAGQSAPAPVTYAIAGQSAPTSATYNIAGQSAPAPATLDFPTFTNPMYQGGEAEPAYEELAVAEPSYEEVGLGESVYEGPSGLQNDQYDMGFHRGASFERQARRPFSPDSESESESDDIAI